MPGDNYGPTHSGHGDIINLGGAQAFGPHARAFSLGAPSAQAIQDLLRHLREDLDERTGLPGTDRAAALAQIDIVSTEVDAEPSRRDRKRITAALAGLTAAVGSVATLADKVGLLEQAIRQLLH